MTKPIDYVSNIWIIEKSSGICFFEASYNNKKYDSDIIAGFLTAIRSFGKEVANDEVREINFMNLKIFMKTDKNILYTLLTYEAANQNDIIDFVDLLSYKFNNQFPMIKGNWNRDMSVFSPFSKVVDKLIKTSDRKIHYLKGKYRTEVGSSDIMINPYKKKKDLKQKIKKDKERRELLQLYQRELNKGKYSTEDFHMKDFDMKILDLNKQKEKYIDKINKIDIKLAEFETLKKELKEKEQLQQERQIQLFNIEKTPENIELKQINDEISEITPDVIHTEGNEMKKQKNKISEKINTLFEDEIKKEIRSLKRISENKLNLLHVKVIGN